MAVHVVKDSADIMKRGLDWSALLTAIGGGAALVTSTWTVTGSGLTVTDDGISAPYTKVILSEGTENMSYIVSNKVTLSNGETYERAIQVKISAVVYI